MGMRVVLLSLKAVFWPPETLRPLRGQPLAVLVQVHQREAGTQSSVILLEAPVSHLVEAEDALQYPERMLHLGSYLFSGEWLGSTPGVGAWADGAVVAGMRLRAGAAGGKSVGCRPTRSVCVRPARCDCRPIPCVDRKST